MQNSIIKVPILGIRRHRLLSDGFGCRTLVGFYGCPLSCSFCLNPECHTTPLKASYRSVQDLLSEVKKDEIYFSATGGGITFGGGEPLLHADFIANFIKEAPVWWNYSCETSLNVESTKLMKVINLINEFIVDIKDLSPNIYESYTGVSIDGVLLNLRLVSNMGLCEKFKIRIPEIPSYNNAANIKLSKINLEEMGFSKFERLTYVTQTQQAKKNEEEMLYNGMNWGKVTCEVLKQIRIAVAEHYNIPFATNVCHEKICSTGTCPLCEQELSYLTEIITRK